MLSFPIVSLPLPFHLFLVKVCSRYVKNILHHPRPHLSLFSCPTPLFIQQHFLFLRTTSPPPRYPLLNSHPTPSLTPHHPSKVELPISFYTALNLQLLNPHLQNVSSHRSTFLHLISGSQCSFDAHQQSTSTCSPPFVFPRP